MSANDIIGISVLFFAYLITWILFFRSLKIVDFIDKENLNHLEEIRVRLETGKSELESKEDEE